MTNIELFSFVFNIISGVVSIALGCFAIWVTKHFDKKSSDTLDEINKLTAEIRSRVDVGLDQQKQFSNKMLDSILKDGKYGPKGEKQKELKEIIENQIKDTENKIIEDVEEKIKNFSSNTNDVEQMNSTIEAIKEEIELLADEITDTASQANYNYKLLNIHSEFLRKYPAHILLLYIIAKEDLNSNSEIAEYAQEYNVPTNWESGIDNLLDREIIIGDLNDFKINENLNPIIDHWVKENEEYITQLSGFYKTKKENEITEKEQKIAQNISL